MKIFPNTPKNQKDKIHHELYENDKKKLFPLQLNEKNHQKSNKTEKKAKNRKKTARHHFNNNHQPNQSKAWPSVANLKGTAVVAKALISHSLDFCRGSNSIASSNLRE